MKLCDILQPKNLMYFQPPLLLKQVETENE